MGTSVERAYGEIRKRLLTGGFAPLQRLREEELATLVGVSRTPVREALRQLALEGFVELEPNRGARVPAWSDDDLGELFSLRALLEPFGARLAATEADGTTLDRLDELAESMLAAADRGDLEAVTVGNNDFHGLVLRASGHVRLRTLMSGLVQVPLVRRTIHGYSAAALRRSLNHHRELVAALRARDPEWSEAIMRAHIRSGYHEFMARSAPAG